MNLTTETRRPQANRFKQHPLLTLVAINLALAVALDATAATAYRWLVGYSIHERGRREQERIERLYRIPSDLYHHDLRKLASVKDVRFGPRIYPLFTDSLGFRNRAAVEVPASSDKRRILFLGDSFTEGLGVEYSKSFVGIIADELARHGIEVMNAGVVSYSPIVYWRKAAYLLDVVGLTVDEVVVHLDVSDIYDEAFRYELTSDKRVKFRTTYEEDLKARQQIPVTLRDVAKQNSLVLYSALNALADLVNPSERHRLHEKRYAINQWHARWTVDGELMQKFGREGLESASRHMDELLALLERRRIPMTLAIQPWPDQVLNNEVDGPQTTFWRDWSAARRVRFIDYFPCYIQRGRDYEANLRAISERYIAADVHFNERGHAVIAENFLAAYGMNAEAARPECAVEYRNDSPHPLETRDAVSEAPRTIRPPSKG